MAKMSSATTTTRTDNISSKLAPLDGSATGGREGEKETIKSVVSASLLTLQVALHCYKKSIIEKNDA